MDAKNVKSINDSFSEKTSEISIVWLKRDLRLHDSESVSTALASNFPVLFK